MAANSVCKSESMYAPRLRVGRTRNAIVHPGEAGKASLARRDAKADAAGRWHTHVLFSRPGAHQRPPRPPPPPPYPPRPPPEPPRPPLARGLASLTVRARPFISLPLRAAMAA